MDAIDFAFLGHPASLDHVADLLPRVRPGLDAARARSHKALLAKAFEWSPPVAVDDDLTLTRPDGQTLHGRLIICTFLPEHAHSPRQLSAAYQKTRGAAALARDLGARLVGLGGFTSIVGGAQEEKLPRELGIAATSGNSLTAALALEQIRSLLSALDWELSSRTVAILGATGDIGQACARGLIETLGARRLRLIARNRFKLESLKATLAAPGLDLQTGADPADAIGADLILAATSTAAPLLDEARLPAGTIVCDIGYPATIAYGAAPRADVLAFSGGLARTRQPLPLSPYTLLPDPALLHGCFAETLALVMAGRYESYSLGQGRITLARMEAILDLARAHGFEPAPIYRGPAPLDTAGLDAFAPDGAARIMTLTERKLQALVAARLKVDQAQVSLDRIITEELGLDSFDLMDIILEIEQAFAPLSLADEAAQNLRTLREVAAYIDRRHAAGPGG